MGYIVTDTRETKAMTQAGSTRVMYRVWLATDRGATGSVDVPVDDWKPETLRAILDAKAADLDLAFTIAE